MLGDSKPNLKAVMPHNAITDPSILGFALYENALLVNFAPSFTSLSKEIVSEEEQLFAYALVNTLCMDERVRKVYFFNSGIQFDTFAGEIYWSGFFSPISFNK